VSDSNNRVYYENDSPLMVRSRWLMQWTQANRLHIAAWITPDAPEIETLVQQARGYLQDQPPPVSPGLVGYKVGSTQQVRDEVDALYDALRKGYHMKYVQENVPYTLTSDSVTTGNVETIKLPSEVLQQHSGMCIELTTLLASAVERIGLHSQVIVVPGHAFLGVSMNAQDTQFEYWDAVDMNNNVAADSANVDADSAYTKYKAQGTLVDTIATSDARAAGIGPML
jgi:hypothetical protein